MQRSYAYWHAKRPPSISLRPTPGAIGTEMNFKHSTRTVRTAIYARHSSDKQNPLSSADQAQACEALVARLGGTVVGTYADPEVSGYRRDRPGLMALLADVRAGKVDMVVCEALDRIARDGEDINWLGKKLRFDHVRLVTSMEGEIDEIKLAVAGLLGSMFLSNLRHKTFRGMQAAVLAGRLAGGRAYGYRKAEGQDGAPGMIEIDPEQAQTVRWIMEQFAAGRSSVSLATELNQRRVPGPRGGYWNASTIRGDPKKQVGILNNPLYRGKLVWGRREWRKDPDSDRRERRYRLRDRSEWIEVAVPDLAIIEPDLAAAVDRELTERSTPATRKRGNGKRAQHLLSGLIKCGVCGSNFTISGKDYYRCAGAKERGTCSNRSAVRVTPLENAVLATLQKQLLTAEMAEMFVTEFRRELAKLAKDTDDVEREAQRRLRTIEAELATLSENLLAGVVGPTIMEMISKREAERVTLISRLVARASPMKADILPHPVLLRRFEEKVARLREALNDDAVRAEAAKTIRSLIESVTIHPGLPDGTVDAEVSAVTGLLLTYAQDAKNPCGTSGRGRSVEVVAGTGFEPVTFRL